MTHNDFCILATKVMLAKIGDINWWQKAKNIFSHNNIRFIESDTFEWGPEKLEILHLDHNYMEVIEQDLFSGKVSFLAGFSRKISSTVQFISHATRSDLLSRIITTNSAVYLASNKSTGVELKRVTRDLNSTVVIAGKSNKNGT